MDSFFLRNWNEDGCINRRKLMTRQVLTPSYNHSRTLLDTTTDHKRKLKARMPAAPTSIFCTAKLELWLVFSLEP